MNDVQVLDTRQLGLAGIVAATAVNCGDGVALFDTGPESTFANVVTALNRIGAQARDVRHVFLSHIHFDHAGAAWRFAESGATIYVHERGAPHLIDPSKIVASATRIFGEEMERLWGKIGPVAGERLKVLFDRETVRIGSLEIMATETPGHASHHHVYSWDDILFGGDIAGVRIGGGPPIPPFVPPELHVESWLASIEKMRVLGARRLYLPHFGLVRDSLDNHFNLLEEIVRRWSEWLRDRIRAGVEENALKRAFAEYEAEDLREGGASESEVESYEAADPSHMAVMAAIRYWQKHHPEMIKASI